MSNEITVNTTLNIQADNQRYNQSQSWNADMTGRFGPVPGGILATQAGVDVDLSSLTTPGVCRVSNTGNAGDPPFELGRWDPDTDRFYPLPIIYPGQCVIMQLSPNIQDEYVGTGTGTTATVSTLRVKGIGGTAKARVEVWEA